jgi:hypothetical protein
MADDYQRKMRVEHALRERDARIAGMIIESVRHALDLLDEQPPSMLEAICDYLKDLRKTDPPLRQRPTRVARLGLREIQHDLQCCHLRALAAGCQRDCHCFVEDGLG